MKAHLKNKIGLLIILAFFWTPLALGQPQETADKSLSPYFWVQSDDPQTDQLPLKSTHVTANVAGTIANVTVAQVYENTGQRPIEAIYVFPASTRAAVYAMQMKIGERTITANIRTREQARQDYEAAKQAGKSASLLEQQRPNVFQMNVANILPGDVITVTLRYTETLVPTDGEYQFVYPTVVGPRFSNQPAQEAAPRDQWITNPYLKEGTAPTSTLKIDTTLTAGLPIQEITCQTHKINVSYNGLNTASIHLDPSEKQGGNRDYILRYRLSGGQIQTGLLLYQGATENFFQLMVQPPKRVRPAQIPPREYIFVVDVSGSMNGFPLSISKKLLSDLIGNLRGSDRFNVILFAGGSTLMSPASLPATTANLRKAVQVIDNQRGGGGTRLLPALQKALSLPTDDEISRSIVVVTDGYISVETEAFELIRNNLGQANLFAFGIGSSVNRHLIEGMARVGQGEPLVITRPAEAPAKAERFRKLIQTPVLTNIKLDFGAFETYDVDPPSVPDVLAQRPLVVYGKWRGKPAGQIRVTGLTGDRTYTHRVDVSQARPDNRNAALRYQWARQRIALLSDYNRLRSDDKRIKEVTDLGLTYNLMTAYTSFVAIDTLKRLDEQTATTVRQPLPLPQGVSNLAVGSAPRSILMAAPTPRMAHKSKTSKGIGLGGFANMGGLRKQSSEPAAEAIADAAPIGKDEDDKRVDASTAPQTAVKIVGLGIFDATTKSQVMAVLKKALPQLSRCITRSIGGSLSAPVQFKLVLEVDARGRVRKVTPDKGAQPQPSLLACIQKTLKNLNLDIIPAGPSTRIEVTLQISTTS